MTLSEHGGPVLWLLPSLQSDIRFTGRPSLSDSQCGADRDDVMCAAWQARSHRHCGSWSSTDSCTARVLSYGNQRYWLLLKFCFRVFCLNSKVWILIVVNVKVSRYAWFHLSVIFWQQCLFHFYKGRYVFLYNTSYFTVQEVKVVLEFSISHQPTFSTT